MSAQRRAPRVLHISPIAFGADGTFGGGERYPAELARAMSARTPTTLMSFGPRPRRELVGNLEVRILSVRARFRGDELNPLSEQLIPAIARADVVHVHQWESVVANLAVVLARAMGKRVFATDLGGSAPNYWRQLRLGRLLTGLLSVTDFASTFYPELAHRASTIYGGVDTAVFAPDPDVRRGPHALFVGRLLPHKGIDLLIRAVGPQTALRVVGRPYDPGYYDYLRELAQGKQVEFVCDADDRQVRQEYQRARVVVLPSLHTPTIGGPAPRAELLGLTLLEGMSCGTPVICTRTGGMPEVVDDGRTGIVVEPHDLGALAAAIDSLLTPSVQWEQRSLAARSWTTERFTWAAVAQRCLDRYRRDQYSVPAL
jgi:glycosyltransferase involved in cell wall biosynthesis